MVVMYEDIRVGLVCSLRHVKMSKAFLDGSPQYLSSQGSDYTYITGRMGGVNIIIAAPSDNTHSTMSGLAKNMSQKFPNIRLRLEVGVGGAAPQLPAKDKPAPTDIRLGDVVIGLVPGAGRLGGTLQYTITESSSQPEFDITSRSRAPELIVRNLIMEENAKAENERWTKTKAYLWTVADIDRPNDTTDLLYRMSHLPGCHNCSDCGAVKRVERSTAKPLVHLGLIASSRYDIGNRADTTLRKYLRDEENILCFDQEGAGFVDECPTLTIRGIQDYADNHKHMVDPGWSPYAAAAAFAHAKAILAALGPEKIANLSPYQPSESTLTTPEFGTQPQTKDGETANPPPYQSLLVNASHSRCYIGLIHAEDIDVHLRGPHRDLFENELRNLVSFMIQGPGPDFRERAQYFGGFMKKYRLGSQGLIKAGSGAASFNGMNEQEASDRASSEDGSDISRLCAERALTFIRMNQQNAALKFAIYDTVLRLWDYAKLPNEWD